MKNKPNPTIAVIYARYSSQKQNDESIEQQVEVCQEYASKHNLKVTNIYADRAVTGTDDKREQFQQMIQDAEQGAFGTIIAYKSNRISRQMLQAMLYQEQLKTHGVRILYAKEEYGDTVTGRFMLRSMMNLNQFYSENLGEDVKRGMTMCAKEGKALSVAPFGYKIENGQFVIDNARAGTVRKIFELSDKGYSVPEITKEVDNILKPNGEKITDHTIRNILDKTMYYGEYSWNGIEYNNIEPIITKDLYDRVKERRMRNYSKPYRHTVKEIYNLTGKLFCADCGAFFVGYSGTSRSGKKFSYYKCKNKECPHKYIRKDKIENIVFEETRKFCLNGDMLKQAAVQVYEYMKKTSEQDSDVTDLKRTIDECNRKIHNISAAIEDGLYTPELKDRLDELTKIRNNAERELKKKEKPLDLSLKDVETALNNYAKITVESDEQTLRNMLDAFIYKVDYYSDKLVIIFDIFKPDTDKKSPADLESVGVRLENTLVTHAGAKTNIIDGRLVLIISLNVT